MKIRSLLVTLLAVASLSPSAFAQEDAEGCKDPRVLSRLNGCYIEYCEFSEYDEAQLEAGPVDPETGEPKWEVLEGKKTVVQYVCPGTISSLQVIRNAEAALKKSGFKPVYSGKAYAHDRIATSSKGGLWVEVGSSDAAGDTTAYTLTVLEVAGMEQEMVSDASAWAAEIERNGRVAIHGIQFDNGRATIRSEAHPVLEQITELLRMQPDLRISVEGHTDGVGAAASNQALSEQRAAAVVEWLVGTGVERSRLTSVGRGATKPVASNDTEEGRARNRRVELVRR